MTTEILQNLHAVFLGRRVGCDHEPITDEVTAARACDAIGWQLVEPDVREDGIWLAILRYEDCVQLNTPMRDGGGDVEYAVDDYYGRCEALL